MDGLGLVRPVLAIDFDGTLTTHEHRFAPGPVLDGPAPGALDALQAYQPYAQLIVHSARADFPGGEQAILDWLDRHGFGLLPITVAVKKPPTAFAFLDDLSATSTGEAAFTGAWPTWDELAAFQPWWKPLPARSFPAVDAASPADAVLSLAARAVAAEPDVTDCVARAVAHAGGILAGLDAALKADSAIAGKLAAVMSEHGWTLGRAAADVKDALRYTAVFDGTVYVAAVQVVLDVLDRAAGLQVERLRNYWLPDETGGRRYAEGTYLGVNVVLACLNGYRFELQFHTPQSLDVQAANWDFYRIIRAGTADPRDVAALEAQMRANNDLVPRPAGLDGIASTDGRDTFAADLRRAFLEPLVADGSAKIPASAHYRPATGDERCATCSYFGAGTADHCGMFDTTVERDYTCDEWAHGISSDALPDSALHAAGDVSPNSTMVCVKPRPDEAAAIAAAGGDPSVLHVTLCYLGEVEGDLGHVVEALGPVAATHAPLEGIVAGFGIFTPQPGSDQAPAILLPDVPGLVELRVAVTEALHGADIDYSRLHGFEAHLTLGYIGPDDDAPFRDDQARAPLHFDQLILVRGDVEEHPIPLTGAHPLTASAEAAMRAVELIDATVAAGDGFCLPAELRTRSDPVRQAFLRDVMTPTLKDAGLSFDVTTPLVGHALSQVGQHVVSISRTTQADLMKVIAAAHGQGLSIPDTAKAIRAHMDEASTVRATMIARTELAGAVNAGSLAATKTVAGATGARYLKTWMTAPGATYPRHELYDGLDGQTVELDAPFDVGGSQLNFPGDPSGDPGEVINCRQRCTMSYAGEQLDADEAGEVAAGAPSRETLRRHNAVLEEAYKRVDRMEPRLVAVLEPILRRAGDVAAANFERLATDHMTAAGANDWTAPAAEELLPILCDLGPAAATIDGGRSPQQQSS